MDTILVKCKPCCMCGNQAVLEVNREAFEAWRNGSKFVQDAFPDMPADQREQLISGTCGPCYDRLFGTEE